MLLLKTLRQPLVVFDAYKALPAQNPRRMNFFFMWSSCFLVLVLGKGAEKIVTKNAPAIESQGKAKRFSLLSDYTKDYPAHH